jgi:hypothetical protein
MEMNKKQAVVLLISLLAISGCATWSPIGGMLRSDGYTVEVPSGWMKYDSENYVMISRDGPFLQYIIFQERPLDRRFRYTRKKLAPDMLPHEAAEVILDDIVSDPMLINVEVLDSAPAIVDDHDGFRLLFRYRNRDGLKLQTLYYGFFHGNTFYNLRFTAAQRYYFESDIETFETIRASFHVADTH